MAYRSSARTTPWSRRPASEKPGAQVVVPANYNSPGQIVIGGDAAAVDRALALLQAQGVRKAVKLAVSVPSHTPLMREAANRLAQAMAGMAWSLPALPVVQNVDARCTPACRRHPRRAGPPALPAGAMDRLRAGAGRAGVGRVGECGPGKVLAGLAKRIDKSLDARVGHARGLAGAIEEWNHERTTAEGAPKR